MEKTEYALQDLKLDIEWFGANGISEQDARKYIAHLLFGVNPTNRCRLELLEELPESQEWNEKSEEIGV